MMSRPFPCCACCEHCADYAVGWYATFSGVSLLTPWVNEPGSDKLEDLLNANTFGPFTLITGTPIGTSIVKTGSILVDLSTPYKYRYGSGEALTLTNIRLAVSIIDECGGKRWSAFSVIADGERESDSFAWADISFFRSSPSGTPTKTNDCSETPLLSLSGTPNFLWTGFGGGFGATGPLTGGVMSLEK